ncbi:DgyrCDS2203 [Dimorphilus gyrociliatus]|uniref:DgyrCDS2203 n=1 Tax=Dimorphilus gyrociliatus TaxID=2664684 RepID=A0A7I8V9S8_9ANNE|nr:DgyrCDS2203 [Dimorphilus gyrociliatus]
MAISLDDKHKEHLSFLENLDQSALEDFCMISIEFIGRGVNKKVYSTAAQKLGVDPEIVKHAVEGLMYLFAKCSKYNLQEKEFLETLIPLNLSEKTKEHLLELYKSKYASIHAQLTELIPSIPAYSKLEWRFDIEIASRSLRKQVQPVILLKFYLNHNGVEEERILQTDPSNLIRLTAKLEEALHSLQSSHSKSDVAI